MLLLFYLRFVSDLFYALLYKKSQLFLALYKRNKPHK